MSTRTDILTVLPKRTSRLLANEADALRPRRHQHVHHPIPWPRGFGRNAAVKTAANGGEDERPQAGRHVAGCRWIGPARILEAEY